MASYSRQAIICVDNDSLILEQLESVIIDNFGEIYVVEIAKSPKEVLGVIKALEDINIHTAVLLTGYTMSEMNGINLIKIINETYPKTKTILLAGQVGLEIIQEAINSIDLYRFIKIPYKKEEIVQMVNDACYIFNQELELEEVYSKLRRSEYEKNLILESIAEEMYFVDEYYNILWMNSLAKQKLNAFGNYGKCYEKLYGFKRPCNSCVISKTFENAKMCSIEKKFPNDSYRLVNYYPVRGKENNTLGIVISMTDITTRIKTENINLALLEVAKLVNDTESILEIYEKTYQVFSKEYKLNYMCVAGKDFDDIFIDYLNGVDKFINSQKYKEKDFCHIGDIIDLIDRQCVIDSDNDFIIIKKDNEDEIAIALNDKVMILVFENQGISEEVRFEFIRSVIEQIKVGIYKIENIKKITYRANHDALTGLYNKDYFMKTVNGKLFSNRENDRNPYKYSLALLDLNFFKEVNDTYGHVVGDEVIHTIAQKILKVLRYGDIVARIGGDEFAFLISHVSKKEVKIVIDRIQKAIAEKIKIGKSEVSIGSSIGIVYEIDRYQHCELAIRDADIAMYEAKKNKTDIGTYKFFEKEIEKRLEYQQNIEKNLKDAILNNELLVKYQPVISLNDFSVVGFEALIRWENQQGTIHNPDEFIPIAEESGDIEIIGQFVLDEVAKAVQSLSNNNCFIAINFSTKQLLSSSQIEAIDQLGLNNDLLRIDVNEKSLYKNIDLANKSLESLKKMGIKINLDDFGTGYSSLSYLNRMEIKDIKIDKTYVSQLPEDDNCTAVVKAIVSLARSLGMTVTAIGVENREQFEFFEELGCEYAQGFYISEPLTLADAIHFKNVWDYEKIYSLAMNIDDKY